MPALLLRGRQNVIDHQTTEDDTRARIENIWLQRPVLVVTITVVLCGLALVQARKVQFRLQHAEIAEHRIAVGGL